MILIAVYVLLIGIHTLLLCVTRGYGYHHPLTSGAALEEEKRSQLEHATASFLYSMGHEHIEEMAGLHAGTLEPCCPSLSLTPPHSFPVHGCMSGLGEAR